MVFLCFFNQPPSHLFLDTTVCTDTCGVLSGVLYVLPFVPHLTIFLLTDILNISSLPPNVSLSICAEKKKKTVYLCQYFCKIDLWEWNLWIKVTHVLNVNNHCWYFLFPKEASEYMGLVILSDKGTFRFRECDSKEVIFLVLVRSIQGGEEFI